MNIEAIIPSLLGSIVGGRCWHNATPSKLPRDANDQIQDFIIWTLVGGQDAEYVDQTFGTHSNARVQIHAVSPSSLRAASIIRQVRDRLLASDYTVGVYGSPVGTYDAARDLTGRMQQFGVWFRE